MSFIDPVVGTTKTKIGETYKEDPIVGTTRTKIGKTHTHTNSYARSYFNPQPYNYFPRNDCYYTPYRQYSPIRYTNSSSISGLILGAVIAVGTLFFISAILTSATSKTNYYNQGSNFLRDRTWKCDLFEECNLHASGAKSNCHNVEENCRWVWR